MKTKHLYISLILLILTFSGLFGIATAADAQEVHALLVILGDDPNIRASVNKNKTGMETLLTKLSRDCRVHITVMNSGVEDPGTGRLIGEVTRQTFSNTIQTRSTKYAQDIITANQVMQWIREVAPRADDTILVYYSGHGVRDKYDDKQYLVFGVNLTDDPLHRDRFSELLRQKPGRLKLLITDTCSNRAEIPRLPPIDIDPNNLIKITPREQVSYAKNLFLEHRGFLDITAASPGQYAWGNGNVGGYFTAALINSINTGKGIGRDGFLTWDAVWQSTLTGTQAFFDSTLFRGNQKRQIDRIGQTTQTPTIEHLVPMRIDGNTDPVNGGFTEIQMNATLDITSTPSGATVYVDGTRVGTTPLRRHEIDTGVRGEKEIVVVLELEGYNRRAGKKTLQAGENATWNVNFAEPSRPQQSEQPLKEKDPVKMARIPAGEFQMGSQSDDFEAESHEKPGHTVYVDEFYIDIHPVTVGQYKRFIRATGHRALPNWVSDYSPTDQHPVVGVSWHDAITYAKWAGKRLPTEAEWEKAARSGLTSQKYPWGNTIDPRNANYGENVGATTTPVDRYAPNTYGVYDMAGNVWEWCLDEYDATFYARSPRRNPFSRGNITETMNNFKHIKTERVLRGGAWANTAQFVRVAARDRLAPSELSELNGFRCVKSVVP